MRVRRAARGLALALLVVCGPAVAEAAAAPQIGPAWTVGVSTTGAGLRAEVNPGGASASCQFEYGTTTAYGTTVSCVEGPGSGNGAVTVRSPTLVGVTPDTTYHYRVDATASGNSVQGGDHSFTSEAFAGAPLLLDDRGWEMVSPVDKNGGQVQGPGQSFGGGVIQAAAGGGMLTYSSISSFGEGAQGAPAGSQYVAGRGSGGWGSENITLATTAGAYGPEPDGVPYQLFSTNLERGLSLVSRPCGDESCLAGYALRESAGGALIASPQAPGLRFAGASPDLAHVVLSSCAKLTPEATEVPPSGGCDPAQRNLYEWSGGGLSLVNLLPAATQGTPGATLAAPAGAVSADGFRVYWSQGAGLYLREGAATKQVDGSLGGGGVFQAASADGAVAFFTKAGHLYRYEASGAGAAADLTPAGSVQGVLGASADGSRVYYQDAAGLELWRKTGTVATVATVAIGADAADPANFPAATGTARVSPDGTRLAFLSKASLTGYDNRGATDFGTPPAVVGVPQSEAFVYDAGTGALVCASCNPTGERPIGPSTIPGAAANGGGASASRPYKPRALSADGRRLFFDSADVLALQDTGNRPDVYEWEAAGAGSCARAGGCLNLISRGRNTEGSSFLDASASGSDAFFLTADSLVGSDAAFADAYDAREGGGFQEPLRPLECAGDACQFLPSEPEDPTPGTLIPAAGNPPLRFPAAACRKGFVRRHGKCIRKVHRRHRGAKPGGRR
jgi:hypothetical protein